MPAPTIAVLTDTFGNGANARANTPTGSTTGSYGTPQSSWGVGNGWLDLVGSSGATPGTGWNIAGGYASCTITGKPAFLMQDPNLTQTPNQAAQFTYKAASTAGQAYAAIVRANPSTDCYTCYYSGGTFQIVRLSGGNATTNNPTSGASSASVAFTSGHDMTVKLTATGDGSTTTTLTATLTDATTSTLLSTLTATDTTLELQSGGRVGTYTYLAAGQSSNISQAIVYSDTALPFTRTAIGFIGDSLTYSLSTTLAATGDIMCRILNARSLTQQYVPVNMGFSGATTANWQNGNASGYLAAAIQNFNAMGVKTILLALGSNDAIQSVTAATWYANMQAIVTYVESHISGAIIYVNFPPYLDWVRFNNAFGGPVSAATLPLLKTYLPYLYQLNGIVVGDTQAISTFQNVDFYGLTDGGHSNDQACPVLVSLWANVAFPPNPTIPGGSHLVRRF